MGYQTGKLVLTLLQLIPEQFSLAGLIAAAIATNLLATGAVAFMGFALPTSRLLPASYYRVRQADRLKKWYSLMGGQFFRKFLLLTFYRKEKGKKYFNGTREGILAFDHNTRQSEFGHLLALLLISLIAGAFLFYGHIYLFGWIMVFNVFLNFYPIPLQRLHRSRTQKLAERIAAA